LTLDALVLGGGIAGASILAQLAPRMKVALLEREQLLAYHATGRSAAMFAPGYGAQAAWGLTRVSRRFFEAPPEGFGDALLRPRSILHVAGPAQLDALIRSAAERGNDRRLHWLTPDEASDQVPILRRLRLSAALLDRGGADIDVARLHEGYLRTARSAGAQVFAGLDPFRIRRLASGWRVDAGEVAFHAPILINATGAWADVTARAAGVKPLGLTPYSRTVVLVEPPRGFSIQDWPTVIDTDERFYFRPFAGLLLVTSANETPSVPCDAAPEEAQIALALDRFQEACKHRVVAVKRRWAGLRTFAPDRTPVIGWSSDGSGLFWYAALGGIGVQTAPAASRLAAALLLNEDIPPDLAEAGVDPARFSPARAMAPP
jgi:D-arginine dehydrogenase